MNPLALHLACGDYEITRPVNQGMVVPEGVSLSVTTSLNSTDRHAQFLNEGRFDVAELSASSYIMARDRGLPFRAIPVFPHRRFRHGFAFINTEKGIHVPQDLAGRTVGVTAFQATALVWLRGILQHEHGLAHRSVRWVSDLDEDIPFDPPAGLHLTRLPMGVSVATLLARGEIDAVLHTDVIPPILDGDSRVARLFPDYRAQEEVYLRRTGIFPIMHVLAMRADIADRHPWLAGSLYRAFDAAKTMALQRMANPRVAPLAWYQEAWERERALLGPDPWKYGLDASNVRTLETLSAYLAEQGLCRRAWAAEDLFLPSA